MVLIIHCYALFLFSFLFCVCGKALRNGGFDKYYRNKIIAIIFNYYNSNTAIICVSKGWISVIMKRLVDESQDVSLFQ